MRRYSIFHPYYLSFGSKDLYRDVARNWKGTAFLYLLILLAILLVPLTVRLNYALAGYIETHASRIVEQFPELVISNGEVSIDKPMPYTITDPELDVPFIVIDSTGSINSLEDTKAIVLITKSKIMIRNSATETRTFDLSHIKDFRLDEQWLNRFINMIKKSFAVLYYPFALLFSFLFRVVQALIYALIGSLFAKSAHASLSYKALVRLAVIATTPAIILNTLFNLAGISFFLLHVAFFISAMAYLWFGIKASSQEETPQEV